MFSDFAVETDGVLVAWPKEAHKISKIHAIDPYTHKADFFIIILPMQGRDKTFQD